MKTINDIVEYLAYNKTKLDEFKSIIIEVEIINGKYIYDKQLIKKYIYLIRTIIKKNRYFMYKYFMYNNIKFNLFHIIEIFDYLIYSNNNTINIFNFKNQKNKIKWYYKVLINNYKIKDYPIILKELYDNYDGDDYYYDNNEKKICDTIYNTIIDDKIVEGTIDILNTFPFVDISIRNHVLKNFLIIEKDCLNKIHLLSKEDNNNIIDNESKKNK